MKIPRAVSIATLAATLMGSILIVPQARADANEDAIKKVMDDYHKAPKGTDTISKKASDGKATPEELKGLVAAYETLAKCTAPKGDAASWKEKTAKLLAAAQALQKGDPGAADAYKAAVNCRDCHSAHRPAQQ